MRNSDQTPITLAIQSRGFDFETVVNRRCEGTSTTWSTEPAGREQDPQFSDTCSSMMLQVAAPLASMLKYETGSVVSGVR